MDYPHECWGVTFQCLIGLGRNIRLVLVGHAELYASQKGGASPSPYFALELRSTTSARFQPSSHSTSLHESPFFISD